MLYKLGKAEPRPEPERIGWILPRTGQRNYTHKFQDRATQGTDTISNTVYKELSSLTSEALPSITVQRTVSRIHLKCVRNTEGAGSWGREEQDE